MKFIVLCISSQSKFHFEWFRIFRLDFVEGVWIVSIVWEENQCNALYKVWDCFELLSALLGQIFWIMVNPSDFVRCNFKSNSFIDFQHIYMKLEYLTMSMNILNGMIPSSSYFLLSIESQKSRPFITLYRPTTLNIKL